MYHVITEEIMLAFEKKGGENKALHARQATKKIMESTLRGINFNRTALVKQIGEYCD